MAKSTSSARTIRLNRIMRQLLFHREVDGKKLMDTSCANTRRTFERDLQFLRMEHEADIVYDSTRKSYRLENRGSFVPTFPVSEREVLGLMAGIKMTAHVLPYLNDDMASLWSRITSALPQELAQKGESLEESSVIAMPIISLDPRIFETMVEAIRTRKTVRFLCPSAGGEFIVSPWELFFQGDYWYLWGSHDDRAEGYTYPLHDIQSLLPWPNGRYASPPKGCDEAKSSCWTSPPGSPRSEIQILVLPPLSSVVTATLWHPTQEITRLSNGAVMLEATVGRNALDTVARWIMARAPMAVPQSPEELVKKVESMVYGLRINLEGNTASMIKPNESGD